MTNIISFFSKKGGGKDSCALFIFGSYLCALGLVQGGFTIKPEGLWVTDILGKKDLMGRFDPRRNTDTMRNFLAEYVDPYIKLYSFADDLKQFCINVLGLKWEQCYGANADKDSLTHLRWENMPGVPDQKSYTKCGYNEFMTGRQVMQYFGTEIVRRMYGPAWSKSTLNRIKKEQPLLAIITDGRFNDEVDEVKVNGGKCIKLLRNPHNGDVHSSESLNIDEHKFDYIMDNSSMTLDEQNDDLTRILTQWELLPQMEILG